MKKCKLLLVLTLLVSAFFVTNVSAVDVPSTGKIVGSYAYGEEKIVDATASLYKVGEVNVAANTYDYELLDAFKDEEVDYSKLTTEQLENHTKKLYSIINNKGIEPIKEVKTSQTGQFIFDNLAVGLYLIKVEDMPVNDGLYRSSPTLIFLPEVADVGSFNYNVSVNMKIEIVKNEDNNGDDNNNNNNGNVNNGQNQNGGSNVNAPNTYDAIIMYVALFIVAAVLLAVLICYIYVYNKKRGRKENEKDEQKK